jgi:glutamine amidotransferase
MCIIAALMPGLKLDKETFDRCWDKNPDGFGIAYIFNEELRVRKTMYKKDAWSIYHNVCRIAPESSMILHFRIGTHGVKDISNCHPFYVNKELVFAHNGMINDVPACPTKELSDTQMFNNLVLKHLPPDFYKWEHYQMLIEKYIGHSKLVFLDVNNELYFSNESKGEWFDGVWFSNNGYKEYKTYVPAKRSNSYYEKDWPELPKHEMLSAFDQKTKYLQAHEMSDEQFTHFIKTGIRPLREDAETKGTSAKDYGYEECEYCGVWKTDGNRFDNVGYLCKECQEDLKDIGVELQGKSMDEIVEQLFAKDKAKTYGTDEAWQKQQKEIDEYYRQGVWGI